MSELAGGKGKAAAAEAVVKGYSSSFPSSMGTLVPVVDEVPATREFDLRQSFQKFPLKREVQLGIMKVGVSVPTRVQDLVIPKILDGISIFMLAQTGTGKTLAYVLPIVNMLLETNTDGFFPMSKHPRAIIVQPTRELAMQTIKVIRHFPLRSVACAPGNSFIKETQLLFAGVDIVVTTPYRLMLHLGKENMFLKHVKHLVIDEADTLCDTFYQEDVAKLLKGLGQDCPVKPQVVVCGATRTGAVSTFMRTHMNDTAILPIISADAHLTPSSVEQVFVPTRGKRMEAVLWDVLAEVPTVGRKTLIFTNRVTNCKRVLRSMVEHGVNAVGLHGGINPKKRKQVWNDFAGSSGEVMVCTNLASRGLDFSDVHHVIMYDFPLNLADYLHRVGRTARGGRAGRVTTITPRRYWPFVTKIQEAAKAGQPIEVRHATKHAKKILRIEQFQKVLQSDGVSKHGKRALRKKLGLPPARNLGNKATKAAMKKLDRRIRAIKQMRFLQRRGILQKGHGIPKMPDMRVESSETQTVSTLVRARDGLLQVMPRRRRQGSGASNPLGSEAPSMPLTGIPTGEAADAKRRRKRTVF